MTTLLVPLMAALPACSNTGSTAPNPSTAPRAGESAPIDTSRVAHSVAARLKDRVYGSEAQDPNAINCVEFVTEVVRECCARSDQHAKFTAELRQGIAIDNIRPDENLAALIEKGDDRIKGVQWALTQAGLGIAVDVVDAQPGDFVQYWYRSGDGWAGHSAVIKSIAEGTAVLLGSHHTALAREQDKPAAQRSGGVGESVPINLGDPARKVFVVRWKA